MIRIGHGYDVHAFGGKKTLVLGGVAIANHVGLVAHSDGDVLLHAVCDALLGAAGMRDIGSHFPDDDEQYTNIDSLILLKKVHHLLSEHGFSVNNLDVTVIAQTPRMASYINQIQINIGLVLRLKNSQVNIKATTTEKLGYIGRNEGIAVHCVCLLESGSENE